MRKKGDETKKYNSSDVNKKTKKNDRTKKAKKKKSKVGKVIKIIILLLFLSLIIGCGVAVGLFYGTFGDELKIEKSELVIPYENSTVYDSDGNFIATLSGGTKRKCISLSEMGEYLPKAYVAIEDERFYEHNGVDIKRTGAATLSYITNRGSSSFGGSSITQQLVKNITNDKEDTGSAGVIRKIKEMSKAIQVEEYLSKDQILELYLNLIFVGGNDINGVELGSIYYFNKKPADLSIAECAFMAGINNSPNAYKPFKEDPEGKNKALINKRTKTVLGKMKELGYINQEQYDGAIAEVDNGLKFQNGDTSPTIEVSYVMEAALNQILEQLMTEKNMSQSMAETYLYSSGLKIYTTQNTGIQMALEEIIKQDKYCTTVKTKNKNGETEVQNSIPTMVIIDNKTGNVVGATTAVGEKGARDTHTKIGYFNIPTKLRKQTGSSMKPIAVIAPGLQSGTLTAATVYNDVQTTFGKKYTPKNYYTGYKGPMTMRNAIEISANIPHVKALADMGQETAVAFCESVGLPKFEEEGLSLALGGLSKGVTVTEMAGAYSAIANDGVFISPTFYKYVTDKNGEVVIEPKQTVNTVMSIQNAYIEKSILTEPVKGSSGTAKYCAIKGMDVAAKTGTTNKDYDRWLCGFTPYYTGVCWYGYETNAAVTYSGNPAGKIWSEVMTRIHEGLPNAEFVKPEGIKEVTVCKSTGLKASETCTDIYKEVFVEGTEPSVCDGHVMAMTCTQTDLLCAEGCPFGEWRYYNGVPPKEKNATKWTSSEVETGSAPTEYCPHSFGYVDPAVAAQQAAEAAAAAQQAESAMSAEQQAAEEAAAKKAAQELADKVKAEQEKQQQQQQQNNNNQQQTQPEQTTHQPEIPQTQPEIPQTQPEQTNPTPPTDSVPGQ